MVPHRRRASGCPEELRVIPPAHYTSPTRETARFGNSPEVQSAPSAAPLRLEARTVPDITRGSFGPRESLRIILELHTWRIPRIPRFASLTRPERRAHSQASLEQSAARTARATTPIFT